MSDNIRELLSVDPLAEAERITGQSYKEDEGTSALGFLMHLEHSKRKEAALKAAADTHFSMTYADACGVYSRLGFEKVGTFPFVGQAWSDGEQPPQEELSVWWHADGLLLTAESHGGDRVNVSKVYYNVRPHEPRPDGFWSRLSSHGPIEGSTARAGDHDAREGLAANLAGLREVGDFLPEWEARPFLWLLTYMDTKVEGYDYKAINEARIAGLPDHVRNAITPTIVREHEAKS